MCWYLSIIELKNARRNIEKREIKFRRRGITHKKTYNIFYNYIHITVCFFFTSKHTNIPVQHSKLFHLIISLSLIIPF